MHLTKHYLDLFLVGDLNLLELVVLMSFIDLFLQKLKFINIIYILFSLNPVIIFLIKKYSLFLIILIITLSKVNLNRIVTINLKYPL
jgi:hypothetical protein